MKNKGGVGDITHSHEAPLGPGGGKKHSWNGINVDELSCSPRKGWDRFSNCRMASNYCHRSSFIHLLSSYSWPSIVARSSSHWIHLISLSSWCSMNSLKYITPSAIECICLVIDEYDDVPHYNLFEDQLPSLGERLEESGVKWHLMHGRRPFHPKETLLGLWLRLGLSCWIILTFPPQIGGPHASLLCFHPHNSHFFLIAPIILIPISWQHNFSCNDSIIILVSFVGNGGLGHIKEGE